MTTKIAIAGAKGRMGRNLIKSGLSNSHTDIVGVFDISEIEQVFLDEMNLSHEIAKTREHSFERADVIIDFTSPKALFAFTESAVASKTGLVIGTTGLEEQHFNLLKQTGNSTRVFYAPNMSFGVNSFFNIARKAASYLKNFDIEIIETHHRYKKDAPSGTAIKLGEEIVEELNLSKDQFNFNRQQNQQERKKDEIGFSSIRGGNIPGEHTVIFHGENESVELTHRAFNREIFADGAIQAAIWLSKQNSGYYTYKDML
ncbi:4-hydroxy-tetrahydrodipicolinate reductase [Alphaproteobacteria bacterium]|jgi:4-hydroxy-tetrahydrodipicolinate reductase|nr:4-hydroxy-tetrahydrodipicolinate reductase [Alphaproteobacteria bacterium]MDB0034573.1 4-hydroxy-tetrahydrodipicolinate reductase [Alphaproteobacteria bacterium]